MKLDLKRQNALRILTCGRYVIIEILLGPIGCVLETTDKPTGERAFESWSGGLLGVLKQEIDDMGTGLKTWLM